MAPVFLHRLLEHLPALRRAGRRLTGNGAEAEDLAQDTIERALTRQGELRDPARMAGWLLAVQRSIYLNRQRGQRVAFEVLEGGAAPEIADPAPDPQQALLARVLTPALQTALDTLPPPWRQALWLREVEERSYEEIAAAQGCPVGTVRSRLARARAALLDALEEERFDACV